MTGAVTVASAALGTFPGRGRAHPRVLEEVARRLKDHDAECLTDSFVTRCGGSVAAIATHRPTDRATVRQLIGEVFEAGRGVARNRGLEMSGERMEASCATIELADTGTGILVFITDRAGPGAWTPLLCRLLADPFGTPRLADDPALCEGFVFELTGDHPERFRTPGGTIALLAALRDGTSRSVGRVFTPEDKAVAVVSSASPGGSALIGTTGHDCLPLTGEWLRAAMTPLADTGTVLFPVAVCDAFGGEGDGLSRCCCLGFQVTAGRLVGPADLFDDPTFDHVRRECLELSRLQRLMAPFSTVQPRS